MTPPTDRDLWRTASTPGVLQPRQWQALVLVYGEDLTHREAAERMGIGHRAVGRLIDRALRRLQHHADHGDQARDEVAA